MAGSRGRLITIEGGEGAGKSTQLGFLAAALGRAGIPVHSTREPGGSPGAEAVRLLLLEGEGGRWDAISEALLLTAARRDHVTRVIAPALARGVWVVCDRFTDSTLAYQGHGKGAPLDQLRLLQQIALGDLKPDLTLILDLPVEIGLARAANRSSSDRFERLGRDFHERLRRAFRQIAADDPARCTLIDASGDAQKVHRAVAAEVERRFGLRLAPHPLPLPARGEREGPA